MEHVEHVEPLKAADGACGATCPPVHTHAHTRTLALAPPIPHMRPRRFPPTNSSARRPAPHRTTQRFTSTHHLQICITAVATRALTRATRPPFDHFPALQGRSHVGLRPGLPEPTARSTQLSPGLLCPPARLTIALTALLARPSEGRPHPIRA